MESKGRRGSINRSEGRILGTWVEKFLVFSPLKLAGHCHLGDVVVIYHPHILSYMTEYA